MAGDDRPPAMPGYASSYGHSMTTAGAAALAQAQGTLLARQQAWLAVRERRLEEARAAEAASASRASAELVAPLMADVVERTAVAALDLGAIFRARG